MTQDFATSLKEINFEARALRQISIICWILRGKRKSAKDLESTIRIKNSLSSVATASDFSQLNKNPHFISKSTVNLKSLSAPSMDRFKIRSSK